MISIKTIEKDDDREHQFCIVICCHDLRRLRAFVCERFQITRINQDFLLAIKTKILKILQNSWDSRYCVRPI